MIIESPSFIEEFNRVIQKSEDFLCITRCSALQRQALEDLKSKEANIETKKHEAIARNDEDLANLLLGFQCVIDALINELEMWVLLKDEEPDAAWDKLVAAQVSSINAARAHSKFSHLTRYN